MANDYKPNEKHEEDFRKFIEDRLPKKSNAEAIKEAANDLEDQLRAHLRGKSR